MAEPGGFKWPRATLPLAREGECGGGYGGGGGGCAAVRGSGPVSRAGPAGPAGPSGPVLLREHPGQTRGPGSCTSGSCPGCSALGRCSPNTWRTRSWALWVSDGGWVGRAPLSKPPSGAGAARHSAARAVGPSQRPAREERERDSDRGCPHAAAVRAQPLRAVMILALSSFLEHFLQLFSGKLGQGAGQRGRRRAGVLGFRPAGIFSPA